MFSRSDEALYRALCDGELSAFDTLYARYEAPLFGFLRRQLGDDAEAEDVLHETFLSLLKERAAGRAARSFKAWLFQVARNACLNRARTKGRASRAQAQVTAGVDGAEGVPTAELLLQHRQAADALHRALAALSPEWSELYHLRAGGLSYEELAEVLGVPLGTVKSRLHELVKRLKAEVTG